MSETKRLSNRNKAIMAMLADGEQLKNFYRFIAQNPHINLHDACQIITERPNATVCYSFGEWQALDRRVTKGRKGIAYYDHDGYKHFVFDAGDTHGDNRYSRPILPMKRLLGGLDEINGTELASDERSDYRKIHSGVQRYLQEQGELSGDEVYNKHLINGITYSLYCKTGFPKSAGIRLDGLPYSYDKNAAFVKDVYIRADMLAQDIEEAYNEIKEEIAVIDDTDEETVSDEPILPVEQTEEKDDPKHPMYPTYQRYMQLQATKPNAVVLYRFGDFYEVFGEKAREVATELELTLTSREVGLPERILMCGMPYHAMDKYLDKILEKHGVLLAEDKKDPVYILSHAEALEQRVKAEQEKAEMPQNDEQPGAGDDWRNELAAELTDSDVRNETEVPDGMKTWGTGTDYDEYVDDADEFDDEYGDYADEQSESEESADESPGEQPKDEVKSTPKKRENGIKDRKRKNKPQPTLFDYLTEPQEKSRLEQVIETEIKYGSGVENGKFRIFDKYQENPSEKAFVEFLKKEYGWGGHSGYGRTCQDHSQKGIKIYLLGDKGEELESTFLKWPEVANRIADLIDDGNYFSEQEIEQYDAYKAEQNRQQALRAEETRQRSLFLERIVLDEPTERKERIKAAYYELDDDKAFAEYIKSEYGAYTTKELDGKSIVINTFGIYVAEYDGKGNTQNPYRIDWEAAIEKITALIDSDRYIEPAPQEEQLRDLDAEEDEDWDRLIDARVLTPVEFAPKEEKPFNRFKELKEADRVFFENYQNCAWREPTDSPWDEVQSCTTIANGIYEVSTAGHGGVMIATELAPHILSPEALKIGFQESGYYCFEEDCAATVALRELWDKGILNETHEYFTHYYVKSESPAAQNGALPFGEASTEEKANHFIWWNKVIDDSLQNWNPEYWKAREQAELADTQWEVKRFVDLMVEEGTRETQSGNYIFYYDHYTDEAAQFAKEHKDEIADELSTRKEVSDIELGEDNFDVIFYLDYCPNYEDVWHEFDDKDESNNTDLNTVLDQSELGGAKTRFRNNVAAIKLVNKLYAENRNPTNEEKKVLSRFVGWGGLSQAFDENNKDWAREFSELKMLLSQEDYEQARSSTLNAYYTAKDVIGGIYSALARFGVKGNNRILEPSMGTGNFFGFMPQGIADGARLYGVELDNLTGRIAAKLYPQANVQIKGFEETSFPNDKFDVVVGNVPFGGYGVADSDYNRYNFKVHDYFLAKSIDKVKPNGIVAIVTSKGTMDKLNPSARKYVAERAELLGAIRLPNTAFKQTAGTEAVADILFFRKRTERMNVDAENVEWLGTGETAEGYEINNYFIQHPEMVLGTLAEVTGLYGGKDVTVKPDGRELSVALSDAIKNLPQGIYLNPPNAPLEEEREVDYNVKPMCYKAESGRLYMRIGDEMVEQNIPSFPRDAYQRIKAMVELREELHHILDIQIKGCSDDVLREEQRKLNAMYDTFVGKYGDLNSQTNTRLFKEDGDSALLFACEDIDEETKAVGKAEIFYKRTIRPYVVPTSTDDPFEALQISRNERGRVDIAYIEELTGKDYDTVLFELGDAVFRDPEKVDRPDKYSGFETAEDYLSGYVVDKLAVARGYAEKHPEYQSNVTALEQVQPAPLTASEISVRLGATWIDRKYYKQFYCELIGLDRWRYGDVEIFCNPFDSSWRLDQKDNVRYVTGMKQKEVYGTNRAPAYRLFIDSMNLKATTIYDTVLDGDGKERRVLNQAETIAAREKQNQIKEAFQNWIYADPKRRDELEETYNRLFNQIRLPSYDGSYLQFPEMNPAIELKPHQKNAVHRIIANKESTLLHHVVGSGKTYTMAASIMKMRQLGLCKKAMVAVPNHLVQQWASEWRKLYPNAKILVATKEDLDKDNRKRFVSKVALGDWDGIIIAQSSFAKIPVSRERQIEKLQQEIATIKETIANHWREHGMPRGAVKNMERIKKSRETALKKLMDGNGKDDVLTFENLGVDYLYVDEAHYYKNLFLFTKMNNVAGLSNAASQRASDLKLKCEYLQELHGSDRGVVFATGTPISNSMAEMYTMQTYLQPRALKRNNITFFDGWAADFGETVTSMELAPSGKGYQARTRFAKFTNLPELLTMYRSFADVQTQDMVKLNVPEAQRHVINLKPSDKVIELAEEIAERAQKIHDRMVSPEEDNMLKITSDGKKLALDPRCFVPDAEDEEGSKLNEAAQRIHEIWERTAEEKGTQIVFCDLSTPKVRSEEYRYGLRFDAYNDLKYKLVQRGIPANEIAFIHDASTDEQKQALFDKVNSGAIRVLIGSTEKCGAGTNVQKRLVALHHLDTPYRPSDMEQREGRIIRQGNTNEKVDIYTYVTERTFDSYSYQILENKQKFISQINKGDLTVREAEDIDETTLSYAEIKAITAANPRIKRKMEVDTEIARLRILEGQHKKNLYALQDKIRKEFPEDIRKQELLVERVTLDLMHLQASKPTAPEAFEISVNGKVYTDRREGGKALTDALFASKPNTVVAEYCGFKISIKPMTMIGYDREVTLAANGQYTIKISDSASGNLTRLDNFIADFPALKARFENRLKQLNDDLEIAKEQVEKPFEHKAHLAELLKEQTELNAELDLDKREEVIVPDDNESDDGNYRALPAQRKYKEDEIIDKEDKAVAMSVAVLPDYSVDAEQMHDYGYTWDGMLPMRKNAAMRAFHRGVRICKLGKDDTETEIEHLGDFEDDVLYGVEKPVWNKYLASEDGKAYLAARLQFAQAAKEVTSNDLDYVDERFTVDFIETNFTERAALNKYLAGTTPSAEAMKPYLSDLSDEYTSRIWSDALGHYGWEERDVTKAIVKHLQNEELKAAAKTMTEKPFDPEKELLSRLETFSEQEIEDMNLPAFDDEITVLAKQPNYLIHESESVKKYLDGLLLLRNDITENHWYVINDTYAKNKDGKYLDRGDKTDVMTVLAYNGLHDGNPLKEFYSEQEARAYFDEKVKAINDVRISTARHNPLIVGEGAERDRIFAIMDDFCSMSERLTGGTEDCIGAKILADMANCRVENVKELMLQYGAQISGDEILLSDRLQTERRVIANRPNFSDFVSQLRQDYFARQKEIRAEKENTEQNMSVVEIPDNYEKLDYQDYAGKIQYGLSDDAMRAWIAAYKSGNKKQRKWIENFLTDMNFHHECSLLSLGKYDELDKEYPPIVNSEVSIAEQQDSDVEQSSISCEDAVINSVLSEFDDFKNEMMTKPQQDVFESNYQIHLYEKFSEVIRYGKEYLSDKEFEALNEDKGHILNSLYDDYVGCENYSVETYGETATFIKDYCEDRHNEIYYPTTYYGKDTENRAYYSTTKGISAESLHWFDENAAADMITIAAPACYVSQDELEKRHIFYLNIGRDIQEGELVGQEAMGNMMNAMDNYYRIYPLYLKTGEYANEHYEIIDHRISRKSNIECKLAIEDAIRNNFDGMHLNEGIEDKVIERFGMDRVAFVVANTVNEHEWDGRFSRDNKEWAKSVPMSEDKNVRSECCLTTHPAVLDSFINRIRKKIKEEENKLAQDKFKNFTARGDKVLSIIKDKDDRNIAIIQRKNDFVVAARYDTTDGKWGQGIYDFKTLEEAEAYREEKYSFENTEDTDKKKWVKFKISPEALIRKYQFNSRFMMPKGSGYEGCAYSIFNDRISESTITTDIKSDTRERALEIRIPEDYKIELYEGNEKIIDFRAWEFAKMVDGTTSDKYEREARLSIRLPREAVIKDYDTSVLLAAPTDSEYKGYVYYLPSSVVKEDTENDNGSLVANVGENFKITLRKGEEKIELTAKQFTDAIAGKNDYKREPTALDEYREQSDDEKKWSTVQISENAVIANYENSTLFKMPKGENAGFVYYIPSGMVRKEDDGLYLRVPEDFVAHLKDGENKKDLSAQEFIAAIDGKTDEDYESVYRAPSEETKAQFAKVERNLRANVPEEMLKKPNWVVVRTRENKDTGRLDKFLINPHTGKFAESDNPETWADFDTACKYAKEQGGVCLAYALDGKDGIACIDLDGCMQENGDFSDIAQKAFIAASGSYAEKSVSGKGLHIFGKTKGADLRSFSKDKTMEYYQGGHFIAMTGDNYGSSELRSFDTPMMMNVLESKLEKRTEWKHTGEGVEGLSAMDDREMLEKAFKAKNGDTVRKLYNGEDLRGNHSNSDMSLMNYLAFWSNHDIDQMLRVFATSGLYRADKPQSYYEHTAIKAVKGTPCYTPPKASNNKPSGNGSGNGKGGK